MSENGNGQDKKTIAALVAALLAVATAGGSLWQSSDIREAAPEWRERVEELEEENKELRAEIEEIKRAQERRGSVRELREAFEAYRLSSSLDVARIDGELVQVKDNIGDLERALDD